MLVRQGVQFLVLLVLARLLTPGDFGAMAFLASIVAIGVLLADAGLSVALVQTEHLEARDISTALTITTTSGSLGSAAMALSASWLTGALGHPELVHVAQALSPAILLTAMGAVPAALLSRRLRFGPTVNVSAMATVTSGVVAIVLAEQGRGIWALVCQALIMAATWSGGMWVASGVSPRFGWETRRASHLFLTGRWVASTNALEVAYSRAQSLLLGAAFGTSTLGYYARADSTQQLTAESASTAVGRVALPIFAASRSNSVALMRGVETGLTTITAFMAPTMGLLAALSTPFVVTVFGEQWRPSARFLSILCVSGFVMPVNGMLINALFAVGRARTVFLLDTVKRVIGLSLLGLALTMGPIWIAWAQVATAIVVVLVNAHSVHRWLGMPVSKQVMSVMPAAALGGTVGLGVWSCTFVWQAPPVTDLLVLGPAGALSYLAVAYALRLRTITSPFEHVASALINYGSRSESGDTPRVS